MNTRTGRWADFATGDRGGDVVSLAAYLHGLRQAEAARKLADMLGLAAMNAYAQDDPFAPLGANEIRSSAAKVEQPDDWQPLPVPDDAPEAPTHHRQARRMVASLVVPQCRWLAVWIRLSL